MVNKEEETLITAKFSMWATLAFLFKWYMLGFLVITLAIGYFVFFQTDLDYLQYVFYGLVAVYVIIYLVYVLRIRRRKLELTGKRFIEHQGGTVKTHRFIPLKSIVEMSVQTSRMGRKLNFGSIVLYMSGRELHFDFVTRPYEIVEEYFSLH